MGMPAGLSGRPALSLSSTPGAICSRPGAGGSRLDDGFAHFDSLSVRLVAIVFMTISGINFATLQRAAPAQLACLHWCARRSFRTSTIMLGADLVISVFLISGRIRRPWGRCAGMFNTISVATTTGYANVDYASWPLFAPLTMLLLSAFVTSAPGSTGGGIKMIVILLVKQARNSWSPCCTPRGQPGAHRLARGGPARRRQCSPSYWCTACRWAC